MKRLGKVVLNLLKPHVRAAGDVASMIAPDGMKVPMSLTSLIFVQPRSEVRSAWVAGSFLLSMVLTHLYILMASRSVLKPSCTRKALIGISFKMISSLWTFAFLKRGNSC